MHAVRRTGQIRTDVAAPETRNLRSGRPVPLVVRIRDAKSRIQGLLVAPRHLRQPHIRADAIPVRVDDPAIRVEIGLCELEFALDIGVVALMAQPCIDARGTRRETRSPPPLTRERGPRALTPRRVIPELRHLGPRRRLPVGDRPVRRQEPQAISQILSRGQRVIDPDPLEPERAGAVVAVAQSVREPRGRPVRRGVTLPRADLRTSLANRVRSDPGSRGQIAREPRVPRIRVRPRAGIVDRLAGHGDRHLHTPEKRPRTEHEARVVLPRVLIRPPAEAAIALGRAGAAAQNRVLLVALRIPVVRELRLEGVRDTRLAEDAADDVGAPPVIDGGGVAEIILRPRCRRGPPVGRLRRNHGSFPVLIVHDHPEVVRIRVVAVLRSRVEREIRLTAHLRVGAHQKRERLGRAGPGLGTVSTPGTGPVEVVDRRRNARLTRLGERRGIRTRRPRVDVEIEVAVLRDVGREPGGRQRAGGGVRPDPASLVVRQVLPALVPLPQVLRHLKAAPACLSVVAVRNLRRRRVAPL